MRKDLTVEDVELVIDDEFKALVPAHTKQEAEEFRKSVEEPGEFEYPILYWNDGKANLIVDGRHRFDLWCSLPDDTKIPPPQVKEVRFPDRAAVKKSIVRSRLGRGNLDAKSRKILIGTLYNEEKRDPTENLKSGKNPEISPKDQNDPSGNGQPQSTAEKVGDETNTAPATVKRYGAYVDGLEKIAAQNAKAKADIVSGKLKVPESVVIAIGKLPVAQVGKAIGNLRHGREWDHGLNGEVPSASPQEESPPKDSAGAPIPKKLIDVFGHGDNAAQLLRKVNNITNEILSLAIPTMPESAVKVSLKDLKAAVKAGLPYAVCPFCKGRGCKQCQTHGYVTKDHWNGIPEEQRK